MTNKSPEESNTSSNTEKVNQTQTNNSSANLKYVEEQAELLSPRFDMYERAKVKIDKSTQSRPPLFQQLYDLPIRTKQIMASVLFQLISIVGIGALGGYLIVSSGRSQLERQASSEVEMTQQSYLVKVNQMGFGSKGQVDNLGIIQIANTYQQGKPLDPKLESTVKRVFQNEINTRKIEYVTLVGTDFKVIVNANKNRKGQIFNPDNLVQKAIDQDKQIKANSIISWEELRKEQANIRKSLDQFQGKNLLVRFVATPVKDPATSKIIGVLIFGDVANGKPLILGSAVAATKGGLNGIYYRQNEQEYTLATSIFEAEGSLTPKTQVALPDKKIIKQALGSKETSIKRSVLIEKTPLTVAAKSIPNTFLVDSSAKLISTTESLPVTVIVRGTPETSINNLLAKSLQQETIVILLALAVNAFLALLLGRLITKPIENLQQTALRFLQGDRTARAKIQGQDEIGQLTATFNELAETITRSEREQTQETKREQQQNKALQEELFKLLMDVEGAASGDLTVRAQITSGQIGIVADFFNSIIESLREIVTQVKESAGQVNTSVGENEDVIRKLASEALSQADQITQTLKTMEEMNLSIQKVALSASSAAEIARGASVKVEVSGLAMDSTVESILELRQTVAETAKKMKRLGESSQQISRVASLINQISLKTNLLAVNASIEASRAGEEGRGFAVVAEEIGQLATQSAEATKEVEQIVSAIQRETNEVIEAMETGTTQVVEGTKTVEAAKQSLAGIIDLSRNIDQLLQGISTATFSQQEKSQIVTQLMEQVAQVAQKTSQASKSAAGSLQETVAIAQRLQASVGTFNISDPE